MANIDYGDECLNAFYEDLKVLEKDGMYYVKLNPDKLYKTKEEATRVSELIDKLVSLY